MQRTPRARVKPFIIARSCCGGMSLGSTFRLVNSSFGAWPHAADATKTERRTAAERRKEIISPPSEIGGHAASIVSGESEAGARWGSTAHGEVRRLAWAQ